MALRLFNHTPQRNIFLWIFFSVIGISACIWLFPSPGTGDVGLYTGIIENFRAGGIQQLFSCIKDPCPGHLWNYPPLYLYILFFSQLLGGWLLDNFQLHKTVIALFYAVSMAAIGYFALSVRPKNTNSAIGVLHGLFLGLTGVSIIINTHGLGYIDIFTYPFIIASFLLMAKRNYFLAGLFFACGFLIKWIPVIMLPLFIIHTLQQGRKSLLYFLIGVALPVLTIGLSSWGGSFVSSYIRSAAVSTQDPYFSAAPNIPLLLTLLFPPLANGLPDTLLLFLDEATRSAPVLYTYYTLKAVFLGYYLWIAFTLYRAPHPKHTIRPLLASAVYAYLGYFFLSTGVHENHLMVGVLCALLLALITPSPRAATLYRSIDLVSAGSMMLFYGISGAPFIEINAQKTVFPATVTLLFVIWFIYRITLLKKDIHSEM